ncbi:magnesium chelatase ATPase subunit I [Chloroherpeton thalassium ATCC 35110]|uniref:Mg-protoporphyrin IX chelatase n=1 Tax=Chloroherpeton thalassium (strain ATCC 35110 / GB-78) TaxID=517418 RepID=B3QVC5_CHLT3|nr:magnesium chelatase ATPase subunit I [Chloroherpeton thalassium]ACF14525.1 magnesium chelatase ATPase subunit I [Chloroherpeton thalassium ATCC 35110]
MSAASKTIKTKAKASKAKKKTPVFPFTAIVGQEEMKLSLLLNVIDPKIGGVLVMGHRGTGKSTTVRALADVLPMISKVEGDPYNRTLEDFKKAPENARLRPKEEDVPVPVVDLPLGATEDRVCGTIDIEKALTSGVKSFEPGLLAQANRGFLYIDEVNLLDDHLVDVLLDVAASGWNVVEREGISIRHPARFVLVGSGNPEEGELRPQLLDRFGLHARINTITDVRLRVEIVKRRREYDEDPFGFVEKWQDKQEELREQVTKAKELVQEVDMPDDVLTLVAQLCMNLGIDGHRGELTITRTSRAYAALQGRKTVTLEDIKAIAVPALRHRLRRDPLETIDAGEKVERELEKVLGSVEVA